MKPLTPQENKVLQLVGQGHSSVEIAYALQISTNTVQSHRKSLLAKFAAKNTAELVKKAIQTKLISLHSTDPNDVNPLPDEPEF